MISWIKIVHIGDAEVMISAAAAIAAWLITGGVWRIALWWLLLFTLGVGLVATSKITFIGWGIGIPSLDFQALSGHAMLTTAVFPVALYLLLQRASIVAQTVGIISGLVGGILMAILLVALDEHSISEVIGGCVVGAIVSLGFIRISGATPGFSINSWLIPISLLTFFTFFIFFRFLAIWQIELMPVMIRVALFLSGQGHPYHFFNWN